MPKINLSYILTTKNKVHFLTTTLRDLIKNRKTDEEIIIVDGASIDGTKEFLNSLLSKNQIQKFVSEPDLGESHATNKAIMLARGELIKIITDDDVFYYPGISECKKYLLKNKEIDILATNGSCTSWKSSDPLPPTKFEIEYHRWCKKGIAFNFTGLGLFFRKNAIPKIGLLNVTSIRADFEYSLRLTSGKPNLAWYTGVCWIRILNPSSNSFRKFYRISLEGLKLEQMYLNKSIFFQLILLKLKMIFVNIFQGYIKNKLSQSNFKKTYKSSQKWLYNYNDSITGKFFYNKKYSDE